MKKLFTLLTLLVAMGTSAWAGVICSAQIPTSESFTTSETTGITAGQTGCTLFWSGLQGDGNIVTVSGVDYYKMGGNSAYVQLKLTSGSFQAGDVLTATVTSNGSNKNVNIKVNTSATDVVKVSNTETKNIEYTLKAGDIEEDGSIKIYRADQGASNLRVAVFSVSRATETFTVTFNAGSNGTCATTSLTEASVAAGVTLPAVTANSGYLFTGWYTAASEGSKAGDAGDKYYPATNITLYAQYAQVIDRTGHNSYYVAEGDEVVSSTRVVCDNITMTYGTAAYKAATADNFLSSINGNYVASIGSDTNGWGVTFVPTTSGILSVGVVINGSKKFSITNVTSFDYYGKQTVDEVTTVVSGTIDSNEWTPDNKQYTIITISVTAGTTYTFSVAGSKMTLYGFEFYTNGIPAFVGNYGWATYVAPQALDFTGLSDIKAYIVTGHSGSAITVEQMTGTVPAGTPLLLEGVTTSVPVATSSSTDVSANLLKAGTGAAVSAEAGKTKYALSVADSKATFKKIASSATIPVGKAYLEFAEEISAPELTFDFGNTTGIENVNRETITNNRYFNLNGQRVAQPTKGLYIVNGKKVILK